MSNIIPAGVSATQLDAMSDAAWDAVLSEPELAHARHKLSINEMRLIIRAAIVAALQQQSRS